MLLALIVWLAIADGLLLEWEAPAACPAAAAVRGRVVQMLGEEAVGRANLQARARVRAQAGGWELELMLEGVGGRDERTLIDGECEALAEAAALMIAVAIDPRAQAVPEDRMSEGVVPAPPVLAGPGEVEPTGPVMGPVIGAETVDVTMVPVVPVLEDRSMVAPRGRAPGLMIGLKLGAGLGFARILPGVHVALDLALAVEGRGWRVEVGGVFAPPVRGTAASDPKIGGTFRLGAGEVRACGVPRLEQAPVDFPLCAGVQLGAMYGRGEGEGLANKTEARALWAATRLGGAARWRPAAGRVGLWLGVDAVVVLTRPEFVTARMVLVHAAAPVGGQVSFGVEVRLR